MAKIARAKQEIFGSTGAISEFGVFGSDSEGAAATSKDPAVIQSLATYLRGLYGSTANATEPPRIQDMNALYYLFARQIAYGMQAGVPEWLATENYYANSSVVLGSDGRIYISKTGTDGSPNINNNPTLDTGTNWRYVWTNDVFSAFPISDLSRVCQINGDGVPVFPDNVAGRTYWQDEWATTDSWAATNGTFSVASGIASLVSTVNGAYSISRTITSATNRLIRIKVKVSASGIYGLRGTVGGVANTDISSFSLVAGIWTTIDGFVSSALTSITLRAAAGVIGDRIEIDTIYIGSGLYDTPVYDKACCNRATNYGVLPVKGTRGQALSFNGGQYLQFDNPVIGTTGTIAFKFKLIAIGISQYIFTNTNAATNGVGFYISATNTFHFVASNGTTYADYGFSASVDTTDIHSLVITSSGKIYFDGIDKGITVATTWIAGLRNLYIGQDGNNGYYFRGLMPDFRYDSRIWTQADVTRYHNGDDAVDSQQKAITGVPHALAVYGADGGLQAHSGANVWDSSNDGSGSGLDADLVRGMTPGTGGLALLALSALGTNWADALAAALGTQAKTYLTKDTQATMAAQILTDLNSRNVVCFNNQVATNVSLSGVHWGPRLARGTGGGYSIAYGDGVLLSADGADVTRSTDKGITWASTSAPFSGSVVRCVCYGGGVWVAVATGGKIARSTSGGATWSTLITNPFSGYDIYAVAYGNGVWLAAGASGKLARSTDGGATWGSLILNPFGGGIITSLAYGNGTFVAVSRTGDAAYSVDGGATWSAVRATGLDTSDVSLFTRVSYGNGVFIAVGLLGSIARSTDGGASWSRCGTVGSSSMNGAAYGNGTWVVVSTDGYVTRSIDDGVTWSARIKNGMYALYDVCSVAYAGNLWVAAGTSSVTRSEIEQWALP